LCDADIQFLEVPAHQLDILVYPFDVPLGGEILLNHVAQGFGLGFRLPRRESGFLELLAVGEGINRHSHLHSP
jgi:hypothetical protein